MLLCVESFEITGFPESGALATLSLPPRHKGSQCLKIISIVLSELSIVPWLAQHVMFESEVLEHILHDFFLVATRFLEKIRENTGFLDFPLPRSSEENLNLEIYDLRF